MLQFALAFLCASNISERMPTKKQGMKPIQLLIVEIATRNQTIGANPINETETTRDQTTNKESHKCLANSNRGMGIHYWNETAANKANYLTPNSPWVKSPISSYHSLIPGTPLSLLAPGLTTYSWSLPFLSISLMTLFHTTLQGIKQCLQDLCPHTQTYFTELGPCLTVYQPCLTYIILTVLTLLALPYLHHSYSLCFRSNTAYLISGTMYGMRFGSSLLKMQSPIPGYQIVSQLSTYYHQVQS